MPNDIFYPEKTHVPELARLMTRAFKNYPIYGAMIPDEHKRERLDVLFEVLTRYAMRYGVALASSDALEGVLLALPWQGREISTAGMIRCGAFRIPLALGFDFLRRQNVINAVQKTMHASLAPKVHMYLWNLAVDPAHQGKGIGARLVRDLLSTIQDPYRSCYLETAKPENVEIYMHLGFRTVGTHEFSDLGFTNTGMLWGT